MLGTQILIHIIMVFSLTSILSNARTPNKSSESSNHFQRWFNLLFFKLFLLSSIHFQLDNCFNLQTSDRITPYTGWYIWYQSAISSCWYIWYQSAISSCWYIWHQSTISSCWYIWHQSTISSCWYIWYQSTISSWCTSYTSNLNLNKNVSVVSEKEKRDTWKRKATLVQNKTSAENSNQKNIIAEVHL